MLTVAAAAVLLSFWAYWARNSWIVTNSGLKFRDTMVGDGPTPKNGQICRVHYTGWLFVNGAKGKKFDSSVTRAPFDFTLGKNQVIKGWEEGVLTMRVGGKRSLILPPSLAYGARGVGTVIPPNSTLIFDVDLLDAR
jgi:peptidylprolyl isomerase